MFPNRYFPGRYFPARYFPKIGADSVIPPTPTAIVHQGGIGLLDPDRKLTWDMLLERARRKRDEEEMAVL